MKGEVQDGGILSAVGLLLFVLEVYTAAKSDSFCLNVYLLTFYRSLRLRLDFLLFVFVLTACDVMLSLYCLAVKSEAQGGRFAVPRRPEHGGGDVQQ